MSRIISLHPTQIYASINKYEEIIHNLEKIVKKNTILHSYHHVICQGSILKNF